VDSKIGFLVTDDWALATVFQSLLAFGDVFPGQGGCYRGIAGME
jgi:hypothetical protein